MTKDNSERGGFSAVFQGLARRRLAVGAGLLVLAGAAALSLTRGEAPEKDSSEISSQSRKSLFRYTPTPTELASLTIQPVSEHVFRAEHTTEGKIAVDEDRSTPVFSPYAGRIMKLAGRPGDDVQIGQVLFTVEATDMVQAQNDFIAAVTALDKARSQLGLAVIVDKRQRDLYDAKAAPLKEVQ